MKILLCTPENGFEEKEIDGSLESMQEAVDGYIETLRLPDDIALVFDEEGKLRGKPFCLKIMNFQSYYNIVGACFFCRIKGEEFDSLTDEDIVMLRAYLG